MEQITKNLDFYKRLPYTLELDYFNEEGAGVYFLASFKELPGCKTEGPNEGDAINNLYELFDEYIQNRIENSLAIPEPEKIVMPIVPVIIKNIVIRKQILHSQDVNNETVDTLAEVNRILYESNIPKLEEV